MKGCNYSVIKQVLCTLIKMFINLESMILAYVNTINLDKLGNCLFKCPLKAAALKSIRSSLQPELRHSEEFSILLIQRTGKECVSREVLAVCATWPGCHFANPSQLKLSQSWPNLLSCILVQICMLQPCFLAYKKNLVKVR